MIEQLGPNMARTIVGDAYNPDFKYELETDDEGFHLIVTNKSTGESEYRDLKTTTKDIVEEPPLFDEEAIEAEHRRHKFPLGILLFCTLAIMFSVLYLVYLGGKQHGL